MAPAIADEPIAIIGYSCILPGGQNVNESWETIKAGLDCISDLPADRVDVESYFDPNKTVPDKIYCTRGGFIPNFDFEPSKFNLNMNQMEDTDTNQTLSLIKVKEALESAQINPSGNVRKNIGIVLGNVGGSKSSHEFYSRLNYVVVEKVLRGMGAKEDDVQIAVAKYKAHFPEWRLDSFPGFLGNVMAGRCANVFNLDGMNCVVDAACASSLIAVKVAIDELLRGDCETMIAGATCSDCSLAMYMAFSKTPVFSTKQGLSAYDKESKGMLIGEGSVMYVLKKLSSARRDGDQVRSERGAIVSIARRRTAHSDQVRIPMAPTDYGGTTRAHCRRATLPPRDTTAGLPTLPGPCGDPRVRLVVGRQGAWHLRADHRGPGAVHPPRLRARGHRPGHRHARRGPRHGHAGGRRHSML